MTPRDELVERINVILAPLISGYIRECPGGEQRRIHDEAYSMRVAAEVRAWIREQMPLPGGKHWNAALTLVRERLGL